LALPHLHIPRFYFHLRYPYVPHAYTARRVRGLGRLDAAEREKRSAALGGLELVRDGMVLGLGTGTTVYHLIAALGERVAGGLNVRCVPTSLGTARIALEHGVPLTDLDAHPRLDLALDGADQIRPGDLCCVKGGGGAHLREKVVAQAAREFVVLVDSSKVRDVLTYPVPLEVLPFAWGAVMVQVEALGAKVRLREGSGKQGPVMSDNGNLVADADFGTIHDPASLSARLDAVPGLLGHGIFTRVHRVVVGRDDRWEEIHPGQ